MTERQVSQLKEREGAQRKEIERLKERLENAEATLRDVAVLQAGAASTHNHHHVAYYLQETPEEEAAAAAAAKRRLEEKDDLRVVEVVVASEEETTKVAARSGGEDVPATPTTTLPLQDRRFNSLGSRYDAECA